MDIPGATAQTYTLGTSDEGYVVRVVVTAQNIDGTIQEASAPTSLITSAAPVNTKTPSVSGTAQRLSTLWGDGGTWSGIGNSYTYQWQHSSDGGNSWSDITGATGLYYMLDVADEGTQLRLQVTASNADGVAVTASQPTAVIPTSPPLNTLAPTVSGTAQRIQVLTATQGTWTGVANTYAYQWQHSSDGSNWTEHHRGHQHELHPRRGR